MKKILLFFALSIFMVTIANAQLFRGTKNSKYENATYLLETTLIVAIADEEQSDFVEKIKTCMDNYWSYTKYKIVNPADIKKYIKKDEYSILLIFKEVRETNDDIVGYKLAIVLGDTENKNVEDAKIVTSISLPDFYDKKYDIHLAEYDYLLPFLITTFHNNISNDLKKKDNPDIEIDRKVAYIDDGYEILQKKERVLIYEKSKRPDFNLNAFCKDFEINKKKVEFVDKEEIEKALEAKDDAVAFVYYYSDAIKIFDAKTCAFLAIEREGVDMIWK